MATDTGVQVSLLHTSSERAVLVGLTIRMRAHTTITRAVATTTPTSTVTIPLATALAMFTARPTRMDGQVEATIARHPVSSAATLSQTTVTAASATAIWAKIGRAT